MTTRLEDAERELDAAIEAELAIRERVRAARIALGEAKIEQSQAAPHEWAGKKVSRVCPRRRGSPQTQRGVVTLCTASSRLRGFAPQKGEWFVLSHSGKTAWPLTPRRFHNDTPWELDA